MGFSSLEKRREYYQKNIERERARDRARYAANPAARKAKDRKWRYGLSEHRFDQLMVAQSGVCALCAARPAVAVDHDHTTGKVRGLLCHQCNIGLGHFADDHDRLQKAIDYLRKHQ